MSPDFSLENRVRERASNSELLIAGIDEAGVGALAGPVIAAAVVLREGYASWLANVDDSKKLVERIREEMFDVIQKNTLAFGVGYEMHTTIDSIGIAEARKRAIISAFSECKNKTGRKDIAVVCDDRRLSSLRDVLGGAASIFSDKADSKSYSCAAASIIAKVIRDRFMRDAALKFPQYKFEKNKGYGTKFHTDAIAKYGSCPIHRLSFKPFRKNSIINKDE